MLDCPWKLLQTIKSYKWKKITDIDLILIYVMFCVSMLRLRSCCRLPVMTAGIGMYIDIYKWKNEIKGEVGMSHNEKEGEQEDA